jgi:hypothetical protein
MPESRINLSPHGVESFPPWILKGRDKRGEPGRIWCIQDGKLRVQRLGRDPRLQLGRESEIPNSMTPRVQRLGIDGEYKRPEISKQTFLGQKPKVPAGR